METSITSAFLSLSETGKKKVLDLIEQLKSEQRNKGRKEEELLDY
ncbi:hypothetical protein QYS49_01020 [Marivirga salinae]|uniref:Uncharacterized protein n=1 Tax=Marivirga salinarum TaxID=3059078 RepID=A0AA49GEH5_9BACT|nr:hypothetical protein [Marivirga sp. BDSF4-3]WKK76050.2 hypothetical protein QYS49_01020 [Marivirga sp. BDSF4-3]